MHCIKRNKAKGAIIIEVLIAMFLLLFGIVGFLYGINVATKTQASVEDGDYLALGTVDLIESVKIQAAVRARSNPIDAYTSMRNPNEYVNGVATTPIIDTGTGCNAQDVGGFFGRHTTSFGIADLNMTCVANAGFIQLNAALDARSGEDYQFVDYNNAANSGESAGASMSAVNIGFIPR